MIIQNDEGEDIEVFTPDEVAAKAAEHAEAAVEAAKAELEAKYQAQSEADKKHYTEKMSEFVKGKKVVETKEDDLNAKFEEIKKIAEEANNKVTQAEVTKNETIKSFYISQTVGADEELTKKLKDAYEMINFPVSTEADIATRVELAGNMIGIKTIAQPNISFSGGVAPNFKPSSEAQRDAEYHAWRKELGLPDIN